MKCTREFCGAKIRAGDRFCRGCGIDVHIQVPVEANSYFMQTNLCSSCNNIVLEGWKFCFYCGEEIIFSAIVCNGTKDDGQKCNTVLYFFEKFCPACGLPKDISKTQDTSNDQDLPRAQRWPFTLDESTDLNSDYDEEFYTRPGACASNEPLERGTSKETLPVSSSETWAGTLAARTFSSAFRIFSKDENLPSFNLTELHQDQPKPWVPPPPPDPPNPY